MYKLYNNINKIILIYLIYTYIYLRFSKYNCCRLIRDEDIFPLNTMKTIILNVYNLLETNVFENKILEID